ncbi:hypothetical protein HCN44_009006 [Aphidius gifuensis]|uniref:PHD-type domain-containing protein n=1 Tax=Aphidius gifuensis TaxID=684658 RepID=A0A835CQD1_APHGI|nr:transcription initiation factor TFIID subunit 3 [Aphidius gifuensis]KAF7990063.1 hypothetical protein HCN44_009006 [Aphidius gifuensis]
MTDYTRSVLRVVVAQICQTIGWHSINSSPLEFLVDLMQEYFMRTYRLSHQYAEILGRTEVNLDDVGLAFQQMSIDLNQLADYVKNVDPVPCAVPVPKYPLKLNENHLNFLKPGSREVVTRPVSIHEHLPAMYPEIEELPDENTPDNSLNECEILSDSCSPIKQSMSLANDISSEGVFKRPGEPLSDSPNLKRPRMNDESRPLREIHSVMMTTSGFLSPAREGKLPEARTPIQARPDTPPPPPAPPAPAPKPSSPPLPPPPSSSSSLSQPSLAMQSHVKSHVPPIQPVSASSSLGIAQNSAINETTGLPQNLIIPPDIKIEKKSKKIIKKSLEDRKLDKENKKKNRDKDLFKPDKIITEPKVKKLSTTKDSSKLKNSKNNSIKGIGTSQSSSPIPPINISNKDDNPKIIKNSTIKEKKDKNITISDAKKHDDIVKLSSEPDKQKLNIFKKLTKSRDDNKSIDVIDNHKIKNENNTLSINNNIRADIEIKKEEKKVPRTPDINMHNDNDIVDLRSPSSDVYMFPDMSPPGTPSTPKTPEFNVPGPADIKKKKKETRGRKKAVFKSPVFNNSPQKGKIHHDMMETDYLGRPKTPEAPDTLTRKDMNVHPSLTFPYYPGGPGLIPHHIAPTMFSHFPIQPGPRGMTNFPTVMHNSATITPHFLQPPVPPQLPPIKIENNLIPKIDSELLINNVPGSTLHNHNLTSKNDTIKIEKISKAVKQEKVTAMNSKPSTSKMDPYIPPDATVALVAEQPVENIKIEKLEKLDKKSKKHKLDKKEKLKKKKDKKDKHKEKSDKIKDKKEKLEKIKDKKEKKEKKKDKEEKEVETIPKLTLKLAPSSPVPSTSTATSDSPVIKKLTIKPLPKKPEDVKRESSPELARISALVTRPPKIKPPKIKKEPVVKKEEPRNRCIPLPPGYPEKRPQSSYINSAGNEIWVCPACGKEDNGTVMIGCDSPRDVCNAWYHWACLRLPGEAQDRETWYCYYCIVENRHLIPHDKKKKKSKKKVEIAE